MTRVKHKANKTRQSFSDFFTKLVDLNSILQYEAENTQKKITYLNSLITEESVFFALNTIEKKYKTQLKMTIFQRSSMFLSFCLSKEILNYSSFKKFNFQKTYCLYLKLKLFFIYNFCDL